MMNEEARKFAITKLKKGLELSNKLKIHLGTPSLSKKTRDHLLQSILESFDQTIALLVGVDTKEETDTSVNIETSTCEEQRKRKTSLTWSESVNEGMLTSDGFSWRKYGQKDILGSKHPRAYYRCTYRDARRCMATKKVRRSDDDASVYEVIYRGEHTCESASNLHRKSLSPQCTPANLIETTENESDHNLEDNVINVLYSNSSGAESCPFIGSDQEFEQIESLASTFSWSNHPTLFGDFDLDLDFDI